MSDKPKREPPAELWAGITRVGKWMSQRMQIHPSDVRYVPAAALEAAEKALAAMTAERDRAEEDAKFATEQFHRAERHRVKAQEDRRASQKREAALLELLTALCSAAENLHALSGHTDVRLKKHTAPCNGLDFCVISNVLTKSKIADRALKGLEPEYGDTLDNGAAIRKKGTDE